MTKRERAGGPGPVGVWSGERERTGLVLRDRVRMTSSLGCAVRDPGVMGTVAALMNRALLAQVHARKGALTPGDRAALTRVAGMLRQASVTERGTAGFRDVWFVPHAPGPDVLPLPRVDGHGSGPEQAETATAVDAVLAGSATADQHKILCAHLTRLSSLSKTAFDGAARPTGPFGLAQPTV